MSAPSSGLPAARTPLVSVVIPMFEATAFIEDALASVAAQDHPAVEVIAVDDGSTDDSAARARAVARRLGLRLEVLHQPNQGPAVARNLALTRARGDYVTFLDADDRMAEGRLSFGVAHLQAHPEVDGVIGTHVNLTDPGIEPPEWLAKLPPPARSPHYLVLTVLARPELFARVGGFDPAYAFAGEDTEWYLRAKTCGAVLDLVDRHMLWRRIHGANLTYQIEDLDRALFRLLRDRARRARDEAVAGTTVTATSVTATSVTGPRVTGPTAEADRP